MIDYSHPENLTARAQALAQLIPAVYINRDAANSDHPLLRLLVALAEPLDTLENAIDQLYGDHFVETASLEALPLLASLVGTPLLRENAPVNRALIAQHVHWLRRKGTVATLEDVLSAASGWSVEVEEAYRSLIVTQDLKALTLHRGRTMVTWDPVAAADPLSRRAPRGMSPRDATNDTDLIKRLPGETLEATLRRLGSADAGRVPIAPRSFDIGGWAQPHIALVRSARLEDALIENRTVGSLHPDADTDAQGTLRVVPHSTRVDINFALMSLDPSSAIERSVWQKPLDNNYAAATLTDAHEPELKQEPERYATRLLTPTTLAADGDAVETGSDLSLRVDGVELIGPPDPAAGTAGSALPFMPVIGNAVLRFADGRRPSPADRWVLRLIALEAPESIDSTVAGAVTLGDDTSQNPATLESIASKGAVVTPIESVIARVQRNGAIAALRLTREALDIGYRRAADGTWSSPQIGAPAGAPLSAVVAMGDAGTTRLVRMEQRNPDRVGIALLTPDGTSGWQFFELDFAGLPPESRPDLDAPVEGPIHALLAQEDGSLLLVGSTETEQSLGLWQIADPLTASISLIRLDIANQARPDARLLPAATLHENELVVYGGQTEDGQTLADLWTLSFSGPNSGSWQYRSARLPRDGREFAPRVGGTLLSTSDGLVLIGGASHPGVLSTMVMRVDLTVARARWLRLPDLPLTGAAPGVLWARTDGTAIETLLWHNRTWPRTLRLLFNNSYWQVGAPELDTGAPNPPADGDALFVAEDFLVTGPPPLPASEIIVSNGADACIAFIPAVDIIDSDSMQLHELRTNGDTARIYMSGVASMHSLRLGAGRHAATNQRHAPAARMGALERLAWQPLKLRQRSLGPWHNPLSLELDDAVGFDPRLGRIALRNELAGGRITVSHRIGRADSIGPGFGLSDAPLPSHWLEPVAAEPPDVFAPQEPDEHLPIARVSPLLSGEPTDENATWHDALESAVGDGDRRVLVADSPRLAPAWLPLREASQTVICTDSTAHAPFVRADLNGVSLSLRERMQAGGDPLAGPKVWFSQLTTEGMIDAHLSSGHLDIRYCRLATPGNLALNVVGAGVQSQLTLRSLPDVSLTIFLYGCVLGTVHVPPWVQLVAAGCTFDANNPEDVAIAADGARIRLRHCTVHGRTRAGLVEASSCVFSGAVFCDQPGSGWLRHSIVRPGGRTPLLYHCNEVRPSFSGLEPGSASYLVLDQNNRTDLLNSAEYRRTPGAYSNRAGRQLELTARTPDFLPMELAAIHVDRARSAELSMNRRLP